MDTKIKILILCFLSAFTIQAQTPNINFAAKFQITSATGGDPYNIVGIVSDDLSRFTGSDVQINDSIYVIDGSDLYVLAVTSITSVVGPTVTLVANDPLDAGVSIPTGQAAIIRPTTNYSLPTYISGLRDDLRSMVMNRQAQLIDEITGGGTPSITDFISAGVAVPPSAPANLNGGETWRNMTTGELWRSDGGRWHPFVYDGKECQDTVLVSAITVQSGGSVTTGSPLIRNSSGVWEHMYNHPSGLNLIPDGVVTDVISGPRAIIQYCGVRKGSGATPNTSYYVDQSANSGFTTTKPSTNIRPLGKVASNGDFLVNAGLLFSRDNSQALPLNQVGFGNPTGTAITSDTTLKFNPTTDKLRVSNPSNKGYVDIGKVIEINPDTLLSSQRFLTINSGRSSTHTYAPWGFGNSYDNPGQVPYIDYIWHMGPNSGGNGVAIDGTKPMAQKVWETSWISGGVPYFEIHEAFKLPDSTAIRLSSYTINYKNGAYPSATPNYNYYHTVDQFNLRGATQFDGTPTYFQVERNRSTRAAFLRLITSPTTTFQIAGSLSGSTATYTLSGSGGTDNVFTMNANTVEFNPATGAARLYSGKNITLQSNASSGVQVTVDNAIGSTTIPIFQVKNSSAGSEGLTVHGNNRVVIGDYTTTPTANLDVVGVNNETQPLQMIKNTSGNTKFFHTSTTLVNSVITGSIGDVVFSGNTVGELWGKYSGSGTNTGWGKFLNLLDPNTASSGQLLGWNGSTWLPVNNLGSTSWQLTGNSVTAGTQFLGSTNNVSLRFRTNNIQRVMIDSTGNVGIANNTPTEKLDVTGNIRFSGALMPNNTAGTSGQVLTSAGAGTVPTWTTNTSESTTIGAFQSSGNSNGLTLSGTDIRLHAATVSTPGGVNVGQQTFGVSSGTKLFNGTGSYQIDVDGDTDNTPAGITFTQLGGADQLGFMYMNSADANNASFRLSLEEGGALTDQFNIGTLNDTKGIQERGGLYEDVTSVTTSPYTVLYGDRNIYLDGTSITVNLQAIGTAAGETKVGRVIYFFNDNATNVTITPNGSETINDSASLTLLPNTGVTLLAVTGTKWVTRD